MPDLYERITETVIRQIDTADPTSWVCPWHGAKGGLPRNALTGRFYRGINILSLWCGAEISGFADDRWATYRQWSELGAQVRKGERGTTVLFFKDVPRQPNDADEDADRRFVARASVVFNGAQVIEADDRLKPERAPIAVLPDFDRFVAASGAIVRPGNVACYMPGLDEIRMPERDRFRSPDEYCSTLAHELVHWTGSKVRLDRDLSTRFRSRAYAAEELVAELGAAFLMAKLGIAAEPHPQHAVYMAAWLPILRDDGRALVAAASLASRAVDFLEAAAPASADTPDVVVPQPIKSPTSDALRPRARYWVRGARIHSHGW